MSSGRAGTLWLVTGERGAGKTTFCRMLVDEARACRPGLAAAGVLSPKQFLGGREAAIDVVDVASGQSRRLAVMRTGGDAWTGPVTIRWEFDAGALAWGDGVLRAATPCDLLVVDEIGPLELERDEGWGGGLDAVDSAAYDTCLVVVRPELLDLAVRRWTGARVIIIEEPGRVVALARRWARRLARPAGP